MNGVPSEATLYRIENGINDCAMADRMQEFARKDHRELPDESGIGEIIGIDGKAGVMKCRYDVNHIGVH